MRGRDAFGFEEVRAEHLVLAYEGPSYRDPKYFTAQVFRPFQRRHVVPTSRESWEKRGLATQSTPRPSGWETQVCSRFTPRQGGDDGKLIEVTAGEFEAVAGKGPGAAELARAKAQLKAGLLMSLEIVLGPRRADGPPDDDLRPPY